MQFFWLVIGIVGILGAIVPAAHMGTEIYFDFQLFMLVVGIGVFYVIGSGGKGLKGVDNFGKGSFAAGSLGFFIALASVPGSEGQALIDTDYKPKKLHIHSIIFLFNIFLILFCSLILSNVINLFIRLSFHNWWRKRLP